MDALVSAFHLDLKIIIAQLINFAIVFIVLYRFALKPLGKLMDERKEKIETGLKDAEKNQKILIESQQIYDAQLSKARLEAQQLIHKMKEEVAIKRQELLIEAENQSESIISSTKEQLEKEKTKMIEEAKREIGALVLEATEKSLGIIVNPEIKSNLLNKSISEF